MGDYKTEFKKKMEDQAKVHRIARNINEHNMNQFVTLLLDNQCAIDVLDNYQYVFQFETHCMGTVEVVAKKFNGRWIICSSSFKGETE